MKKNAEILEIEQEIDEIVREDGIDGLKEFMITSIMAGVEEDLNRGCDDDYTKMLRVAKDNDLWNPDVLSLAMVSKLPLSTEQATMNMRSIVVNSDGSEVDLSDDQIKFVNILNDIYPHRFS